MDTNRTHKFTTVGVFKAHHDNLYGVDIGRADGAAQHDTRPIADSSLRRSSVYTGTQATRLRHVVSIHGDILWHGDSVRNALADIHIYNRSGHSVVASAMAIHEGLSENAHHGIPRSECRPAGQWLSHNPIEDSDRFWHVIWQGLIRGHAEPVEFLTGESHGLYICGSRRRIRICRSGSVIAVVYDSAMARDNDSEGGG